MFEEPMVGWLTGCWINLIGTPEDGQACFSLFGLFGRPCSMNGGLQGLNPPPLLPTETLRLKSRSSLPDNMSD